MNSFAKLLTTATPHVLYDVGAGSGEFSLLAATQGWHVTAFEIDPDEYLALQPPIRSIYTKIGLNPSLDHFIDHQPVGIIKITIGGNELEVIKGLRRSLDYH